MYNVDMSSIKNLTPHAKGEYIAAFADANQILEKYNINNRLRVCHFFAQIAAETGGLRIFEESLNYSAQRLTEVWPSHFHTLEEAEPYAHNEEALGNFIYGPRIHPDLGNTEPGDGYRFRGRGLLQTTGRFAYKRFGILLSAPFLDNPNLVYDHKYSLAVAAAEFSMSKYKGVSTLTFCDEDDIEGVTHAVNGGLIGLSQRKLWLKRAKEVFPANGGAANNVPVAAAPAAGEGASRAAANIQRALPA